MDDIPHRTIDEYEWSFPAYFAMSGNSGSSTPVLSSDGLDWPVSLDVLAPSQEPNDDGQVFNRTYEVQMDTVAELANMESLPTDGNVWIDKASMLASICASSTDDSWKKLVYVRDESGKPTSIEDVCVPARMRESILKLKDKTLFLGDDYFKVALTQLETFLTMIRDELNQEFVSSEIADLCHFDYTISGITFKNHSNDEEKWADPEHGLFGYERGGTTYQTCVANFNNHLLDEFKRDWRKIVPGVVDDTTQDNDIGKRDYHYILNEDGYIEDDEGVKHYFNTAAGIECKRSTTLEDIYDILNYPPKPQDDQDIIDQIFGYGTDVSNSVRFINAMKTQIDGNLVGMFVADATCNLFVMTQTSDNPPKDIVRWYTFDATKPTMETIVRLKIQSDTGDYVFEPKMQFTQYPISNEGWLFKMLNRDFVGTSRISDAFAIHCVSDATQDLWYVPQLDAFIYGASSTNGILDMAYEQYGDRLYVLFNGDNHLYVYDNVAETKTFKGFIILKKETATLKLVTFNSMRITDDELVYYRLCLDYFRTESNEDSDYHNWRIVLYGRNVTKGTQNKEIWSNRPGFGRKDYLQRNNIIFGDSRFDEGQLRFHNISKNKDMYDILDVNEVGGRYYGLFKNENSGTDVNGEATYTIFKAEKEGGVVQRLPWTVLLPKMYRTNDSLYSLYVVSNEPNGGETYHPVLREISVPDSDEYLGRTIDITQLYKDNNGEREWKNDLKIHELMMDEFKHKSKEGQFFALTNKGFHRMGYGDWFKQLSIDKIEDFKTALKNSLSSTVLKKHMDEMHDDEQYFRDLGRKINQFDDEFSAFDLIPTEFSETQDVGVIPSSKIDDTDEATSHLGNSILISTDILWTGGMFAQSDTNPGMVTCAVSNPATIYDDDNVFTKSQRNPSIEGTEFYDFIYDQDGNTLMDLYAIPFIYRINSNNTYDLYINVPTTRTKYLNRLAGTLEDNGTSQVETNATRTRLNFGQIALANNLDESTTRLRVFLDKKFLSIGTVELVEISGNSIPTQIYRDVPNNGLYDSIALESRWTGEVTQMDEPSKDINKVMLEFECYGTDSQSIHIQGKTLINRALDESKYGDVQSSGEDEPEYTTIAFDANGGDVDETSRIVVLGEPIGELPTPTRANHEFVGWFVELEASGEDEKTEWQVQADSVVTLGMNVLKAHWKTEET